jgi:hypothetical protein
MAANSVHSSASVFPGSGSHWLTPISQLTLHGHNPWPLSSQLCLVSIVYLWLALPPHLQLTNHHQLDCVNIDMSFSDIAPVQTQQGALLLGITLLFPA